MDEKSKFLKLEIGEEIFHYMASSHNLLSEKKTVCSFGQQSLLTAGEGKQNDENCMLSHQQL